MSASNTERHICAGCYYFRSAIVDRDVVPEQDWGLCVIRSSKTVDLFSPETQFIQKEGAKIDETLVEGTNTCKFWTKISKTNL